METFSALLALCAGNSPVTDEFPAQRPVTRNFDIFFSICAWINGWLNNRGAGDLRHHRARYDVTVMTPRVRRCEWEMITYWLQAEEADSACVVAFFSILECIVNPKIHVPLINYQTLYLFLLLFAQMIHYTCKQCPDIRIVITSIVRHQCLVDTWNKFQQYNYWFLKYPASKK